MKKVRMLAWLLIIAMLSLACPALGEGMELELGDDAAVEASADIELDAGEASVDLVDPDELAGDIAIELPNLDLSDDLSDATDGDVADNGGIPATEALHYSRGDRDNDVLFAGYVDLLFGKTPRGDLRPNGFIGDTLSGLAKKMYDNLLKQIKEVAAGTSNSTIFKIPENIATFRDWDEIGDFFSSLVDALLTDCPYHLYWFDKTSGVWANYDESGAIYFMFCVEQEYADMSGEVYDGACFTTDAAKISAAQVAVTKAKSVVKKYAGVSDYEKLCGYRDFICNAVDYNDDAVADDSWPYGNPWQLIWAFDGDPSTNIVCEGYAKAFQYLCDLSTFNSGIQSHVVTGTAVDTSGSGPHMWNIVTMGDGKNYHMDVTFIDSGFPVAFLAGATSQSSDENYYIIANEVAYYFDSDTLGVYPAKTLKLSTRDFDPDSYEEPSTVEPTGVAITQGKSATLYMGNTLALKAKLTPEGAGTTLKWTTSNKAVATVSNTGVVTPKKAGKATITVKTANGLSAKITVKVVDASGVKLKKGSTTLKKGQKIKLARGKSVTLTGVISPSKVKTALTWTSSYKYVTVKDGKVTVSKKAKVGTKAKITVKTANKKSTYIYIVVK